MTKFTTGGGHIAVSAAATGETALIHAGDSGIGIPEPDQDGLFKRFFRAVR